MKQWAQVLVLAAILTAAINVPAFGGTSLAHKVTSLDRSVSKLNRRVNALAVLETTHGARVFEVPGVSNGTSGQQTVACPAGSYLVGGGAGWNGQGFTNDHIVASYPTGNAWFASGSGQSAASPGALFNVYAVCAQ